MWFAWSCLKMKFQGKILNLFGNNIKLNLYWVFSISISALLALWKMFVIYATCKTNILHVKWGYGGAAV